MLAGANMQFNDVFSQRINVYVFLTASAAQPGRNNKTSQPETPLGLKDYTRTVSLLFVAGIVVHSFCQEILIFPSLRGGEK